MSKAAWIKENLRDGEKYAGILLGKDGEPDSIGVKSGKLLPYRTAAECIDWSIRCPSIFERSRPLAPATMRRIAKGIMRYVVNAASPFIVGQGGPIYSGKPVSVNQPFGTLTAENHRAVVLPSIVPVTHQGGDRSESVDEPFRTVTGANRGEKALAAAYISPYYSDKRITDVRDQNPAEPINTIPTENRHAVVAAFLSEHANASNQRNMPADEPLRTICAQVKGGHFSMVSAHITKFRTGATGSDMAEPMPTITAGPKENPAGAPHALGMVSACLVGVGARAGQSRPRGIEEPTATVTSKYDTAVVTAHIQRDMGQSVGHAADAPLGTIMPGGAGKAAVVASHLVKLRGTSSAAATDEPLGTISAGGTHHAEVRAFLLSYYGSETEADSLEKPVRTVTSRDRFGLVTIHGQDYQIVDIGLRMLAPRELYRAQGFPDTYIIGDDPSQGLKLTKSAQVRMCGNSVCPPMARALIEANFAHERDIVRAA